jgi:hypothetical protein
MKWVRANIKLGARVAVFALAVQFALSFGHFHAIAAQAAPSIESAQQLPAPDHDSDQHPDDFCAICAVIALASTAIFVTPPVLPPPQAMPSRWLTTEATYRYVISARGAFQPRAPPLS